VWNGIDFKAEAHRDPWSVPLDEIDVSNPYLYSEDTWHGFCAGSIRPELPAASGNQDKVRPRQLFPPEPKHSSVDVKPGAAAHPRRRGYRTPHFIFVSERNKAEGLAVPRAA
jgi:hypothetical protein